MKKFFGEIVLQANETINDWRAFVHCQDSKGQWWEIRAYGSSPEEAAKKGWERYNEPEENWDINGYSWTPTKG